MQENRQQLISAALLALLLSACSTTSENRASLAKTPVISSPTGPVSREQAENDEESAASGADKGDDEKIEEAIVSVDNKVEEEELPAVPVGDEISHATTEKIPIEINEDVQRWIEYFTVKDRDRFQRFLERGEKYKTMIGAVLRDQGIPTELYYQAMIESGFTTHATSHAAAVGIWQFIPGTGKRYGLRVDSHVDERRDPMRATIAASLYLKDLNNVFQSWYLAMAAYNAGEMRIMGAIMRSKTRDFWEMVQMRSLPTETMDYIPKFLAATIIGHNPQKYGFEDLSTESMPTLASVSVPSPVKLTDLAQATGIPLQTITEYNPHLLRGVTPPGGSGHYRIWVPKEHVETVEQHQEEIAALRVRGLSASQQLAEQRTNDKKPQFHRVKRGETLGKIAARYDLSLAALRKMNNLHSNAVRPGMQVRVVPKASTTQVASAPSPKAGTVASSVLQAETIKAPIKYKVRRGDNLKEVAARFNMSVQDLKKLNKLKRNTIYSGQVLKVSPDGQG